MRCPLRTDPRFARRPGVIGIRVGGSFGLCNPSTVASDKRTCGGVPSHAAWVSGGMMVLSTIVVLSLCDARVLGHTLRHIHPVLRPFSSWSHSHTRRRSRTPSTALGDIPRRHDATPLLSSVRHRYHSARRQRTPFTVTDTRRIATTPRRTHDLVISRPQRPDANSLSSLGAASAFVRGSQTQLAPPFGSTRASQAPGPLVLVGAASSSTLSS